MVRAVIEQCERRRLLAGVTLIIPAWDGGLGGWISAEATQITTKLGGPAAVSEYTLTVAPTSTNGPLASSITHIAGTATPQTGSSGQIVVFLDYTSVSTNPNYALSYVASVATAAMENTVVDGIRLSELPLHEVSISRGTGEEDEVAKALDQSGIWVEQETYLDPHIVSEIGDAPNAVYDNVEFADEYWRTTGDPDPVSPEVNSYPVAGAYQSNIQSEQEDYSGQPFAHVGVGTYYNGTIDPPITQAYVQQINSDWYGDGYPASTQTGFYYSQIDGGTRPLSGVWPASGGTGSRTAVTHSGTQWPNIGDVSVTGSSRVPIGQSLSIHYIQQDSSNASTVTLFLDSDADPYNGNFVSTLQTTAVSASSKVASGSFTASTAGLAPGTYYICAEINDGQGRYRFSDSQPITLTQPASKPVPLTGTVIGTSGSYNNDGNVAAMAFDGNTNTFFDAPGSDGNWVGLDLGTAQHITTISYAPRVSFESRMIGGVFQASNDPTFATGVATLSVVTSTPGDGYTTVAASDVGTYRYVRYLSPSGSYGNIAEMQVFGSSAVAGSDTQAPTQPAALAVTGAATSYGVALTWGASSDNIAVDHYNLFRNNVLLGSTINSSFTDVTASAAATYTYTVQAVDAAGNASSPSALTVTTAAPIVQLSGTVIGTAGSNGNSGNTAAKAFDGDGTTYFDGPTPNGDWVGLDLGAASVIDRISFSPRIGYESDMVGGVFQGSNSADFSSGVVTLATITNTPNYGDNGMEVSDPNGYRYVRYLGPTGSYGDIAEMKVLGVASTVTPPPVVDTTPPTGAISSAPSLTTATTSPYTFTVNWTDNVAVNASSLGNSNLLVTNGSGYSQLATLVSSGLSNSSSISATYSIPAPSGGWTSSANGTYTIALQPNSVSDTSGNVAASANLGTFSVNIPAPVTPGSGALAGQSAMAASSYNLTTLGTSDWAHWGRGGNYGNFDHKASGGSQISNVTVVGSGAVSGGYYTGSRAVSWTGGSPTSSVTNDNGYIWSNGALNTGYSFTVPASTTSQTLYVYAGGYGVNTTLRAHLSDGSAADYVATSGSSGTFTNLYTITFKAASVGQTLTITLLKTGNITGTQGSADLIAAALAGAAVVVPDTTPPTGAISSAPSLTSATTSPYTFTVNWTDNVAVNAASLGNSNLLVTNGSGYSQLATLVSSGLSNSSSISATYSIPAPSGGWTNNSNGTYTIALQPNSVSDTSGNVAASANLGTFSVNIAAPVTPGSGALAGQSATAASSYNLTTLGTSDWAHWGRGGNYGNFDHKASGGSQISNVTVVGSGAFSGGYYTGSRAVSWTGGSPTSSVTNDNGYIWSNGALNTGYSFTVPAGTTNQTLYVYAGGYGVNTTLRAHLSDGSAADYVATSGSSGTFTNLYTITFKAASAGQTLTITLLKTGNITGTQGSADLIAAALA